MDLIKMQMKQRNRVAFILSEIVMCYILVSVSVSTISYGAIPSRVIRIVIFAVLIFINTLGYIILGNGMSYVRVCLNLFTIAYITTLIGSDATYVYAYVFPMYICVLIFMNKVYVYGGVLIGIICNAAFAYKIIRAAEYTSKMISQAAEQFCLVVLVSVGVVMIFRQNRKFSKENEQEIMEKADAAQRMTDTIVVLAEQLGGKFDSAKMVSGDLTEMMKTSNFSVSNIADSTSSTAQAIEQQTSMSADIQQTIEEAGRATSDMQSAAKSATEIAEESSKIVDELKKQAQDVQKNSNVTKETTYHLNEQVKNVDSIVASILTISNQTNLLALNASIEAARAGEAGKGFAVVADQIRELSEETKNASNRITEITSQLITDAQLTTESMEQSVVTSERQNELIVLTDQKFADINGKIQSLNQNAAKMNDMVQDIVKANGLIADSISQLSATSEEVSASSSECLSYSDNSMEALQSMNALLEEIYAIAEEMKECVQ